jgi:hypothetical protein
MAEKQVPTGVKVISVLFYIGAALTVLGGIALLIGGGLLGGLVSLSEIPLIGALGAGVAVLAGIIYIALGVLMFFVGRGLWKGANWARIVAIILAIIGLLSSIMSIAIISIIIDAAVAGYLLFSKDVKAAFS